MQIKYSGGTRETSPRIWNNSGALIQFYPDGGCRQLDISTVDEIIDDPPSGSEVAWQQQIAVEKELRRDLEGMERENKRLQAEWQESHRLNSQLTCELAQANDRIEQERRVNVCAASDEMASLKQQVSVLVKVLAKITQ